MPMSAMQGSSATAQQSQVHGEVFHHVDTGKLAPEVLRHAGGGVGHGLGELHGAGVLLPGGKTVVGFAGGVNQRLARPGGAADGELLQRPAVAAHGMALKVGPAPSMES